MSSLPLWVVKGNRDLYSIEIYMFVSMRKFFFYIRDVRFSRREKVYCYGLGLMFN